jgi:HlyD family secretion protein
MKGVSMETNTKEADLRSGLKSKAAPRRRSAVKVVAALAVLAVVAAGIAWWIAARRAEAGRHVTTGGTAVVRRGDLIITVTEGGNLRAKTSTEIINRVEGSSSIVELIPEGTQVKAGDVLVRLDAADLQERLISEDAKLQTLEADYLASEESLAIQLSVRESQVKAAELNETFAKMDFEKYRDGDWPQRKKDARNDITVAEQQLVQAQNRLRFTVDLEKDGIVTREELVSDELSVTKADISHERAKEALRLLEEYDYPKQIAKLQSDWQEAMVERQRVQRRQDSEVNQRQADRNAKKANYEIQKARVDKLREQIDWTTIRAPQAGMIVYWTPTNRWSDQRPPEVGGTVRHRQTLMALPDVSRMEIDVKIHESQIDRVRPGQSATIIIDAFPDRRYTGTVTPEIGVMADSQRWQTPDVKVYNVVIGIDQATDGLKPGMSARVEIICDVIRDKLLVPVTGVHTLRGKTAAIVRTSRGLEIRHVRVGPTNDKHVIIEEGLDEGDAVMLYEPDAMPTIPWEEPTKELQNLPPADLDLNGDAPRPAPAANADQQNDQPRRPRNDADAPAGERRPGQGQGRRTAAPRNEGSRP